MLPNAVSVRYNPGKVFGEEGGGGVEMDDATQNLVKIPCSHNNKTALIKKNIPTFIHAKYLQFQFKI